MGADEHIDLVKMFLRSENIFQLIFYQIVALLWEFKMK